MLPPTAVLLLWLTSHGTSVPSEVRVAMKMNDPRTADGTVYAGRLSRAGQLDRVPQPLALVATAHLVLALALLAMRGVRAAGARRGHVNGWCRRG